MVVGLALLATFAYGMIDGVNQSHRQTTAWRHQLALHPPPAVVAQAPPADLMQPIDGVDFGIRVPKIDYYAAVREGVDATILYSGPGHYPETRWPGQEGMVGVAAHNVYWIDFPKLTAGDGVVIETRYGIYNYTVTSSRVAQPDDRTVLVQSPGHHLILTTCWPTWAGSLATERYIIYAEQVLE